MRYHRIGVIAARRWSLAALVLYFLDQTRALDRVDIAAGGRSQQQQPPPPPPNDISVIRASPNSVVVTWSDRSVGLPGSSSSVTSNPVRVTRYQISYRPLNDRFNLIQETPGDRRAIIIDNLRAGTRYRVHVTAVSPHGRSNHSDVVLFDTDSTRNESRNSILVGSITVRPEEIGIVVVVLALWVFVVVLFFNKWGKIRMLEPFQPPYKPRAASCSLHNHSTRLSLQLASFTSVERERLLYGTSYVHRAARPRQNSVFVGNPYTLSRVTPSRKVKSAENLNSLVFHCNRPPPPTIQTTNV